MSFRQLWDGFVVQNVFQTVIEVVIYVRSSLVSCVLFIHVLLLQDWGLMDNRVRLANVIQVNCVSDPVCRLSSSLFVSHRSIRVRSVLEYKYARTSSFVRVKFMENGRFMCALSPCKVLTPLFFLLWFLRTNLDYCTDLKQSNPKLRKCTSENQALQLLRIASTLSPWQNLAMFSWNPTTW